MSEIVRAEDPAPVSELLKKMARIPISGRPNRTKGLESLSETTQAILDLMPEKEFQALVDFERAGGLVGTSEELKAVMEALKDSGNFAAIIRQMNLFQSGLENENKGITNYLNNSDPERFCLMQVCWACEREVGLLVESASDETRETVSSVVEVDFRPEENPKEVDVPHEGEVAIRA